MSAYYLMYISVAQSSNHSDVVKKAQKALRGVNTEEDGDGELIWLFKVVGESRMLAVTKNTPEPFWEALTSAVGSEVTVTCEPLRPYENFSKFNKVDPDVCGPTPGKLEPGDKKLYFVNGVVTYKGYTVEQMLDVWRKESDAVLRDRQKGEIQIELYKVIGANRALAFMVGEPDKTDDFFFQVPLVKAMGDCTRFYLNEIQKL